MYGSTRNNDTMATSAATRVPRALPIEASHRPSGQTKNLIPVASPTHRPPRISLFRFTPRSRGKHCQNRSQVRKPDLAEHLRPECDCSVNPPVTHTDQCQRDGEADGPQKRDDNFGRAKGKQRERRNEYC